MLVTVLEIVAFMAAAAVLGVSLGWVLRGMFGNEQAEISDVRAQLRKLKKAQREQQAVKQEQTVSATTVATSASQSAKATPVKQAEATSETIAAEKKTQANSVTEKPAIEKKSVEKKPAAKNKAGTKVAKKKNSPRKTVAERDADQALARQAFAAVAERVGQSDVQDNLTKMYGVGKRYAEMLNELGLSSYAQIGKLRKADVKILSGALGILDARVDTEDWVGSAKILAKEAKK